MIKFEAALSTVYKSYECMHFELEVLLHNKYIWI
jgi:hypothetical protein